MSTVAKGAKRPKSVPLAKRPSFEAAWEKHIQHPPNREGGLDHYWLSAFCLAIVYPLTRKPFHPANLLAVPSSYSLRQLHDYHFADLRYAQDKARGYNGSSRGHKWSTWGVVAVDPVTWRVCLQLEHFRVWSEWARTQDHPTLRPSFGKSYKDGGGWHFNIDHTLYDVTVPRDAPFRDLLGSAVTLAAELQRHYQQQVQEYFAFAKKHPVDLALPKGFPTVVELRADRKEAA